MISTRISVSTLVIYLTIINMICPYSLSPPTQWTSRYSMFIYEIIASMIKSRHIAQSLSILKFKFSFFQYKYGHLTLLCNYHSKKLGHFANQSFVLVIGHLSHKLMLPYISKHGGECCCLALQYCKFFYKFIVIHFPQIP